MSQTVARALRILDFIAQQPHTLSETADLLGVHRSTALRLLQTLEADGYARHQTDGRYTVGFRVVALARQVVEQLDIRHVARPHLVALAKKMGHTVHLAALVDDEVVHLDKIDGNSRMRMPSRVGKRAVPHASEIAKVILAHAEPTLRERLLAKVTYERFTPTTIISPEALRAELAAIAERGWAEDNAEFDPHLNSVALPLYNITGAVCAAMAVTSVRTLTPLPALRRHLPDCRAAADRISRELGFIG